MSNKQKALAKILDIQPEDLKKLTASKFQVKASAGFWDHVNDITWKPFFMVYTYKQNKAQNEYFDGDDGEGHKVKFKGKNYYIHRMF